MARILPMAHQFEDLIVNVVTAVGAGIIHHTGRSAGCSIGGQRQINLAAGTFGPDDVCIGVATSEHHAIVCSGVITQPAALTHGVVSST